MNTDQPEIPLESWKEIAAYLQRNAVTARRWEKEEGLPVHRHSHKSRSSVYAYPSEIDAWRASRKVAPEPAPARPLWKIPAFALTMLLCLVMVGNGIRPVSAQQPGKSLTARLVMSDTHGAIDIEDITADGRLGVGVDWSNGDLVVTDLASGKITRLLPGTLDGRTLGGNAAVGRYVAWTALSQDHRQIVFAQYDDSNKPSLWVIANEPGAKPRLLTNNPEYKNFSGPVWSADGKSILLLIHVDRAAQLAWVSAANGSVKVLTSFDWDHYPDYRVKLSPDGKYIAYSLDDPDEKNQYMYTIAADGSRNSVLTNTAGLNESPAWTPDGSHIVFVSNRAGSFDLWAVAVRDGKATDAPVRVKKDIGRVVNVGMTRSGSYFYTLRDISRDRLEYISIADLKDGGAKTSAESLIGIRATWSPDGKSIAFKRRLTGNGYVLVVHSLETGEERTYSTNLGTTGAGRPMWFHDGKGILTGIAREGSTPAVYRVDVKSGEFKEIAGNPGPGFLSPDDKTLYIAGRITDADKKVRVDHIVAFDLATQQQKVVFTLPGEGEIMEFSLSPDSKTLVMRRQDAKDAHLGVVGVDGSGYREIYTEPRAALSSVTWSKDGRSILFGRRKSGDNWETMRLPVSGGKAEPTGVQVRGTLQNLDLTTDGLRLALSAERTVEEVWALDNITSVVK